MIKGGLDQASSDGPCPAAELSSSSLALIIVFAAPATALVQAAVLGVFDMPLMVDVQFAQQRLQHGLLQSAYLALSMMALAGVGGYRQLPHGCPQPLRGVLLGLAPFPLLPLLVAQS